MKQREDWTLITMKILRLPIVQKHNPYDLVSVKQMDALEKYLRYTRSAGVQVTVKNVIDVLKENDGE